MLAGAGSAVGNAALITPRKTTAATPVQVLYDARNEAPEPPLAQAAALCAKRASSERASVIAANASAAPGTVMSTTATVTLVDDAFAAKGTAAHAGSAAARRAATSGATHAPMAAVLESAAKTLTLKPCPLEKAACKVVAFRVEL